MESKEMKEILSKSRKEDMSWLCSLSESELDFLISLKFLILQRAKIIGHEELADQFDLKTLRALGLILMEYLKGKIEEVSLTRSSADPAALMDVCNLLKCNPEDIVSVEDLKNSLLINSKNRPAKRTKVCDSTPSFSESEDEESD